MRGSGGVESSREQLKLVKADTYVTPVVLTCDFAGATSAHEQCVGHWFESSWRHYNGRLPINTSKGRHIRRPSGLAHDFAVANFVPAQQCVGQRFESSLRGSVMGTWVTVYTRDSLALRDLRRQEVHDADGASDRAAHL